MSSHDDVSETPAWTAGLIADEQGIDTDQAKAVLEFGCEIDELRCTECANGELIYWPPSSDST